MPDPEQLERPFFSRSTLQVARELLGMRLVRQERDVRLVGVISEVEAYRGEEEIGRAHV